MIRSGTIPNGANMNPATAREAETSPDLGRPWKVLLVDDHPVVREGLAQRIALESDLSVCATCDSARRALQETGAHHPDLVIVDLSLPNGHGLDLIKQLHTRHPKARVLVFSMHDEQTYGERALLSGAHGYVMKDESPDEVLAAIRKVLAGKISISAHLSERLMHSAAVGGRRAKADKSPMERLSNRELEVLEWLGHGLSVRTIAGQLHRSAKTIETYRQRLKEKLRIESNAELIIRAARWMEESSNRPPAPHGKAIRKSAAK